MLTITLYSMQYEWYSRKRIWQCLLCRFYRVSVKSIVQIVESVDTNFMIKEHDFKHLKLTFSQTLSETVFDEKLANREFLAKKIFNKKVICTNKKIG